MIVVKVIVIVGRAFIIGVDCLADDDFASYDLLAGIDCHAGDVRHGGGGGGRGHSKSSRWFFARKANASQQFLLFQYLLLNFLSDNAENNNASAYRTSSAEMGPHIQSLCL